LEECCKEQGQLVEASKEGLGSKWAVVPMMMINVSVSKNCTETQNTYIKNPVFAVGVTVFIIVRETEHRVSETVRWEYGRTRTRLIAWERANSSVTRPHYLWNVT
jgi:hypothetical protein